VSCHPDRGSKYLATAPVATSPDAARNRLTATLTMSDPVTAGISGVNAMTLELGSLAAGARSDSAFVDDRNFAATESSDPSRPPASRNGAVLTISGDPKAAARTYLVSADLVPQTTLLPAAAGIPAGQLCSCEFTRWGWWGSEVKGADPNNAVATRTDRFHLGTWVAGSEPTGTLPNAGAVTFNGRAVGSVDNNGTSYIAAGSFTGAFNIAARSGTVAIDNFDTRSYSGPIAFTGNNYSATLSQSGGPALAGLTGRANGSFFGPA